MNLVAFFAARCGCASPMVPRMVPPMVSRMLHRVLAGGVARWRQVGALTAMGLGLAGCGGGGIAPQCPQAAIVQGGDSLNRYRGEGRDLTDLILAGRIQGLAGRCHTSDHGRVLQTEVSVKMLATRGPAARESAADMSYFVVVMRGDQILDKQVYPVHVLFPPNTEQVRLSGQKVHMSLPTPRGISGPAYKIEIGFQLTPEELEANRRFKTVP